MIKDIGEVAKAQFKGLNPPLKLLNVGCGEEIKAFLSDDFSEEEINAFLDEFFNSIDYLSLAMLSKIGDPRFDLQGEPTDQVLGKDGLFDISFRVHKKIINNGRDNSIFTKEVIQAKWDIYTLVQGGKKPKKKTYIDVKRLREFGVSNKIIKRQCGTHNALAAVKFRKPKLKPEDIKEAEARAVNPELPLGERKKMAQQLITAGIDARLISMLTGVTVEKMVHMILKL